MQAGGIDGEILRGGIVEGTLGIGEEGGPGHAGEIGPVEMQHEAVARAGGAIRSGRRLRQGGAGAGEERGLSRGRLRGVRHRQIEAQLRRARNADLLADEVGERAGQPRGLAGLGALGNLERHQQGDGALVAEIHQGLDRDPLRDGPLHRADREALGQAPRHLRRQAGIARIAPVDVPARLHRHVQAERHRAAGHQRLALGHELGPHEILGLDRRHRALRPGETGGGERQEEGKEETEHRSVSERPGASSSHDDGPIPGEAGTATGRNDGRAGAAGIGARSIADLARPVSRAAPRPRTALTLRPAPS
ncbi:hypothetical protein CHKEEEPN_2627 [Methylorubrum podarium]|nr:hypothetical protein CHKEEEPN_2627 [Methylorubrum podarium]